MAEPVRTLLLHLEGVLFEPDAGPSPRARPGAQALLDRLAGTSVVLLCDGEESEARDRLAAAGLRPPPGCLGPLSLAGLDRSGVADQLARLGVARETQVFLASGSPEVLARVSLGPEPDREVASETPPVVAVGLRDRAEEAQALEVAGAWFVASDLLELGDLLVAPRRATNLSFVLLAYNEAASIAEAIRDVRRFCAVYAGRYELVVIDDGSTDDTGARALAEGRGDLRVIRHDTNQGMGAGLRDGFRAARGDYLVPLPADRQVRPQSLVRFLPHLGPSRVVVSRYLVPHSGPDRALMTTVFRLIRRHLGGLRVDFAGAYVFHRRWVEAIDLGMLRSETFVFSFELLERLRQAGCAFHEVPIYPFLREHGQSREAALRRILRVAEEVLRYRWRTIVE